jgi:hypothetical protein
MKTKIILYKEENKMSDKKTARQIVVANELEKTREDIIKIQVDIAVYESLQSKLNSNEITFEGTAYSFDQTKGILLNMKDAEKVYLHKLNMLKEMRDKENEKKLLKSSRRTMAAARAIEPIRVEFQEE